MRRIVALAAAALALALPGAAAAAGPTTVAVIGDTPYGADQEAQFPGLVAAINRDPKVRLAVHVGDIKTGSTPCSDEYFARIRGYFDAFRDPLVYTPGDNEWTDCHRPAAGGHLPTERLAALRRTFFPTPWLTLGRPRAVLPQSLDPRFRPFVENRLWHDSRVVFSTVHVVGSDNDLAPWFGAAETADQRAERLAEFDHRMRANLAWLDATFALARASRAPAVVVAMQADMFSGGTTAGFVPVAERLERLAREFRRPVLLIEGDSHRYLTDHPLPAAPNLTRIVVEGETASEWLRLKVDPRSPQVFSWERVFLGTASAATTGR